MTTITDSSGPFGRLALLGLAVTSAWLAWQAGTLVRAGLASTGGGPDSAARLEQLLSAHADASATWQRRFVGRSLFHGPTPPVAVPPAPRPIGIFGDEVWFRMSGALGGLVRLRAGCADGPLAVKRIDGPASIVFSWHGEPHDVVLFEPLPPGALVPE